MSAVIASACCLILSSGVGSRWKGSISTSTAEPLADPSSSQPEVRPTWFRTSGVMGRVLLRKNLSSSSEDVELWQTISVKSHFALRRSSLSSTAWGSNADWRGVKFPVFSQLNQVRVDLQTTSASNTSSNLLQRRSVLYLSPPKGKLETNWKARLREKIQDSGPLREETCEGRKKEYEKLMMRRLDFWKQLDTETVSVHQFDQQVEVKYNDFAQSKTN